MNGILNKFALKRLPHSYTTMMEPEIGLLMCSLVGIRPNSSCLDPFCGSCSLLAYATIHGASFTVGLDVNKNSEQRGQIMDNFKYLGLEPPTRIIQANAESLLNSKYDRSQSFSNEGISLHNDSFDFIITDPPYGMSESIITGIYQHWSPCIL